MNMNHVARTITLQEGGKVNLPIGQVKEVLRLTLSWLATLPESEAAKVIRRYSHQKKRRCQK